MLSGGKDLGPAMNYQNLRLTRDTNHITHRASVVTVEASTSLGTQSFVQHIDIMFQMWTKEPLRQSLQIQTKD